jgi:hypothetical protein
MTDSGSRDLQHGEDRTAIWLAISVGINLSMQYHIENTQKVSDAFVCVGSERFTDGDGGRNVPTQNVAQNPP